jgi:Anti-sigma-K factor rskA
MARAMPGPGRVARAMRGSRRLVCALAAAVLVAGSAVTTWEITRPAPATDRIAALSAGSGTVATVVAHQHGADVITDMLPSNSGRGTAYYIWGVPAEDGGTPQVVGTFEVTTTGLHSYPLRLTRSVDGFPVLAISEEKAGSLPSAPSGVLGKGALG